MPKVAILATIYQQFPTIAMSLHQQTHQDWMLYLIHDGPTTYPIPEYIKALRDPRIHFYETETRRQKYGHPIRRQFLEDLKDNKVADDIEYVVITNADNYYAPPFLTALLSAFTKQTIGTYCQWMVHNYFGYQPVEVKLQRAGVDIGGCMIRRQAACDVGWVSDDHSSDWIFLEELIRRFGANRFRKSQGCLFTHN